ncbi:MAG TPA: universal stress protein, partial [Solirubrobacteraceae bacterium]
DLVVVGARVLGAMASLLLGRVSTSLTREAPCSVLVCKGEPRPIRSVTVALDGSEHARAALRFFTALPLPSGLRVHLVAAVEPLRYPSTAPAVIGPHLIGALKQYEQEQLAVLEPMLEEAAVEIRRAGPAVTTAAVVGPAAEVIVGEASKHASDLVVMGARGLGTIKRLLLGSVSESVLRHAGCPVLIVRPRNDDAR